MAVKPTDLVVMVGHFGPLIPRIRKIGCQLDILDLNTDRSGIIDPASGPAVLADCDVAIITATSIINATIENLLGHLQRNRTAVLLGPSTPICAEAFAESRVTQLSGSLVKDPGRLKQVISQGGGTMLMKKYLQFVNIDVER